MCLVAGGSIRSLSSVFVDCTVRGAAIDLAGPFANLIVGTLACALAFRARRALRLFFALATGFNFLWFALQLVFSVVTRSDDFAWAMQVFHVSEPLRYGLIATGVALYMLSIRIVARAFLPFGPSFRARRIVWTAWLKAGVFACITALFDRNPAAAILRSAAPQSLALSIGLLFLPRYVANAADEPVIQRRISWLHRCAYNSGYFDRVPRAGIRRRLRPVPVNHECRLWAAQWLVRASPKSTAVLHLFPR